MQDNHFDIDTIHMPALELTFCGRRIDPSTLYSTNKLNLVNCKRCRTEFAQQLYGGTYSTAHGPRKEGC